jgi:hypothetical protein
MKLRKVYYPKWFAWFMLVILIPILFVVEYEAFFGKDAFPLMGAVVGFMFAAIILMMFLVSYRKVPLMYIER